MVWLGSSSSGSPMRLVSGVIHACSHLKAWLGLRIHFGGGATHRAGKSVLAVCGREASAPLHGGLSTGYLGDFMA